MPLLYYWRPDDYRRDLDMGAGYHLNQANPILHQVEIGDSLWAFTRNLSGHYVLAAELVIKAKTENPPNYRYGRYRVWGDISRSRYFRVDDQPSIEQIIRHLSCRANARFLGQSFQGYSAVRSITQQDHLILQTAARDLSLEPRARILPEERLEAALLLGASETIERLITDEAPGIAEQRGEYLYQQAPTRNPRLIDELQVLYGGRCQICLWHPREQYGQSLCHGHHIHWLSRGGEDRLENIALVCPNHHAAIHRVDAPLDYRDLAFDFGIHREILRLNLHLVNRARATQRLVGDGLAVSRFSTRTCQSRLASPKGLGWHANLAEHRVPPICRGAKWDTRRREFPGKHSTRRPIILVPDLTNSNGYCSEFMEFNSINLHKFQE